MRGFEFEKVWEGVHAVKDPDKRVDAELRILRGAREAFSPGLSFALPTFGDVRAETMICVDRTMRVFQRQGVKTALVMNAQTLLPDCREQIAEECVRGPRLDVTLWVDSDMVFEPDTVWRLYQKVLAGYRFDFPNHPTQSLELARGWVADAKENTFFVWGCPYATRGREPRLCIHPLAQDQGSLWIDEMEGLYEQVEVAGIGLGLAMVPTAAMALLSTPLFERPWRGTGYQGEDLAFCQRIRDAGGVVFVDFSLPAPGHLVVVEKTLNGYYGQVKARYESREVKREGYGDRGPQQDPESRPRPASEPVTPEGQGE